MMAMKDSKVITFKEVFSGVFIYLSKYMTIEVSEWLRTLSIRIKHTQFNGLEANTMIICKWSKYY